MTGQELFYALSFVDEKYVSEAETARIAKTPWMKYLSVAACLCILLLGVYGMKNLVGLEKMPAADAPAAMAPMADAPAADAPPMEDAAPEADMPAADVPGRAEPETIPAELHHVGFAHLRILEILEEGSYRVYVERVPDEPGAVEAGVEMTLVIDPEMIPGQTAQIQNDLSHITEGMLVMIENGAYDAGSNTLYVAEVTFLCREDHE
jgi:hypothetical protein